MDIQRFSWAGIAVECDGVTALIDPLVDIAPMLPFIDEVREPVVPIPPQSADYALITHVHFDHYSPATLRSTLKVDGHVICHAPISSTIEADGFAVIAVSLHQQYTVAGFTISAVPAVDGLGDDQVSWVVEGGARRVIHCGDTLWHGHWWNIQRRFELFDMAFLPINGALVQFPNRAPSGVEASMTPQQAAAAGSILAARVVCPIHYDLINTAPIYVEYPNARRTFAEAADARGLSVAWLQPGEAVTLQSAP